MQRLKSAPNPWFELPGDRDRRPYRPARPEAQRRLMVPSSQAIVAPVTTLTDGLTSVARAGWMLFTLPFRLAVGVLELLGRLLGLTVGFVLMVFGAALFPSPFLMIGIPVFAIGLLLSMRSLG